MTSRESEELEGTPLVEPRANDVPNWTIELDSGGRPTYGPMDINQPWREGGKTIAEMYPNLGKGLPAQSYDGPLGDETAVLTPQQYRAGYRLDMSGRPPVNIRLSEEAAANVARSIEYIDDVMPRLASRLQLSPHLMFTIPELAASIDTTLMEMADLDPGLAVAPLMQMMVENGDRVFKASSIENVLAATEVTAEFWGDWGDFFLPEQRDIVATVLATTPVNWRDRVAALAYRYLSENHEKMSTSEEAMSDFLVWLWQEGLTQKEMGEWESGGIGGLLHNLSKPYYAVQEGVSTLYANIVAPEDVAWRKALTPGQTLAISMGADPSESGWTWKSGALDFIGTFVLDPINIVAGMGFGWKTARAFPIAQEAASKNRAWRALKSSVPLLGRRTADYLPVGSRSAWQRVGYHLFAKDIDNILETRKFDRMAGKISEHVASGGTHAGLVEKMPKLRALMGEDGGGLQLIFWEDKGKIKEGFKHLLQGQSEVNKSTAAEVRRVYQAANKRVRDLFREAVEEGAIGLDDLNPRDYAAANGAMVLDNPGGSHALYRHSLSPTDGGAVRVWTEAPRRLSLQSNDVIDFLRLGSTGADEAYEAVDEAQTVRFAFAGGAGSKEMIIESRFGEDIAGEVEEVIIDLRGPAQPQRPVMTLAEAGRTTSGESSAWTRRVRVLLDPDAPLASVPEDIITPVRMALYAALPDDLPVNEAVEAVDKIIRASFLSSGETLEKVAELQNTHGLPIYYTGLGASFGGEQQVPRWGEQVGTTYRASSYTQPKFSGESPISITESYPWLFRNSLASTTDPNFAGHFNDLGQVAEETFRSPVEFVIWNQPKPPRVLDLDSRSEEMVRLINDELAYMWAPRETDVFEEGTKAWSRQWARLDYEEVAGPFSPSDQAIVDETIEAGKKAFEIKEGRKPSVSEVADIEETSRALAFQLRTEYLLSERLMDDSDTMQEFIRKFTEVKGRKPKSQELQIFKEAFGLNYSNQLRAQAEADEVIRRDIGSEKGASIFEYMFDAEDEAFIDQLDVIETAEGGAGLRRMNRAKQVKTMYLESDLETLTDLLKDPNATDGQLMYALRATLETGGVTGERINKIFDGIERRLGKNYDAVRVRRGPTLTKQERRGAVAGVNKMWQQAKRDLDAEFGIGEEFTVGPRIISGGQTGVDRWALEEGKAASFDTGGTAPKGYRTDAGNDASLADFGLAEHSNASYVPRTQQNVDDADVTIAFLQEGSVGTDKTIGYAQTGKWQSRNQDNLIRIENSPVYYDVGEHKPVGVVSIKQLREMSDAELAEVGQRLRTVIGESATINFAGPRSKSLQPGDEERIRKVLRSTFGSTSAPSTVRPELTGKPFEVSTRGTASGKRFSALNATINGKTIEDYWQIDIKGYPSRRAGKGKPPRKNALDQYVTEVRTSGETGELIFVMSDTPPTREQGYAMYQKLWDYWADNNPELIDELYNETRAVGRPLRDSFAREGGVSQAEALENILDRVRPLGQGAPPTSTRSRTRTIKDLSPKDKAEYLRRGNIIGQRRNMLDAYFTNGGGDEQVIWLGGRNKAKKVRTAFNQSDLRMEFTVPANERTRALMIKTAGSEVFLDLPPKTQAAVLRNMERSKTWGGIPLGRAGALDVESQPPAQFLDVPEDANIFISTEAARDMDEPGFAALRPDELPTMADPTDPLGNQMNPLSTDANIAGTDIPLGARISEDIAQPAIAGSPDVPPPMPQGNYSAYTGEFPSPTADAPAFYTEDIVTYPSLDKDDMDILVHHAQAKGYDSVTFDNGWELLTPQGERNSMLVRRGKGTGARNKELAEARAAEQKAYKDLVWADALDQKHFFGLKSMPYPPSYSLGRLFSDWSSERLRSADLSSHFAKTMRRIKASLMDPAYPEGVSITDTQVGYTQLRSFLRHMGVSPLNMERHLNTYLDAPVSKRYGIISDIISEVAEEVDHPILRAGLKDWASSGGVSSYAPYMDNGTLKERTPRSSRTRAGGKATSPALPSHLSNIHPMPTPDYYKALRRYQSGKSMPQRVNFLSTIGGAKNKRIESGQKIIDRLRHLDAEAFGNLGMEEALLLGYANVLDENTFSYLQKAVRSTVAPFWRGTHRMFTRVQLAARPFTWMWRVVFFDEMARGAMWDMPSLYRAPMEYFTVLFDSAKLQRDLAWNQEFVKLANSELRLVFNSTDNIEDALAKANEFVPNFVKVAEDLKLSIDSPGQIRNAIFDILATDTEEIRRIDYGNFGARVRKARRKALRGDDIRKRYKLPEEFTPQELLDIGQKGFTNAVLRHGEATMGPMVWRPGLMSNAERQLYGAAYGHALHQFLTDPWGQVALRALASQELGVNGGHITALVDSSHFRYMRQELIDVAEEYGVKWNTDADLAQFWMESVLLPMARDLLEPLGGDSLRELAVSLSRGRRANVRLGERAYDLRWEKNSAEGLTETITRMVSENPNHSFNPVAAHFDMRRALAMKDRNTAIRASDWLIETFGERATQYLNRRPAWIRTYRDEMSYLLSRGMDEETARHIASAEATRRVNHVYFNMKDVPQLVQELNKVIPFFSAMYEVTGSWAFKVPLAMSPNGWPAGVGVLGRKVDRFMRGLIGAGLVEVDDEPDEASLTRTRQLSLVLDSNLASNVDLGVEVSKGMRSLMKGPELMVKWLASLSSAPIEAEDPFGHISYRVGLGNPIDPGSHGFGSALQMSAGLNPLGSAVLGRVRERTPWAGDSRRMDFSEGDTLADIALQTGKEVVELINWNTDLLTRLGVFTQTDIHEHMRGIKKLDNIPINQDLSLRVPGSSVIGEILDEVFFPFDQVESGIGTLAGFTPSWMNFFLRGWGLHNAVGEDTPWEMTDDGRIIFNYDEDSFFGGAGNVFVNMMIPPESRTFMAGEVINAMQHLEATEGVITHHFTLVETYQKFRDELIAQGMRLIEGENGLEIVDNGDPRLREAQEQLLALKREINNHNSMIIKRATEIGAFSGMVRGFAGLMSPANPRVVWEDAAKRALYYNSRDAIEDARLTDSELAGVQLPRIEGVKDIGAFFTLANLWLEDQSGDAPQVWLKQNYPEILPFLKGKTYWIPGGERPEIETYNEYVDQIRAGLRQAPEPEVMMIMQLNQANSIEREVSLINKYGNDAPTAARLILEDYWGYKEAQEEYQQRRDYILMVDDQLFDGKYQEFSERTREEYPLLFDDFYSIFDDAIKDLELAQQALALNPEIDNAVDLQRAAEDLDGAAAGLRQVRRQFEIQYAEQRPKSPREELITMYFDQVYAPWLDKQAEFFRRSAEPGISDEDRSLVFYERRIYENEMAAQSITITAPDGTQIAVPTPLEYRSRNDEPAYERNFVVRDVIGNPKWNNLYDNITLVNNFPRLGTMVPTDPASMRIYDQYDKAVIQLNQMKERFEISETDRRKRKKLIDEELKRQLTANGKEHEMWYMMEATPAERAEAAGLLDEFPDLKDVVAAVRQVIDMARANDEGINGSFTAPAWANMMSVLNEKWDSDPMWAQRLVRLSDSFGYEQFFMSKFFPQFFLGIFNGEF